MKKRKQKNFFKKEENTRFEGRYVAVREGFGFVVREGTFLPDLFIPPGQNANAINGDIVEGRITGEGIRGPVGRILSIVTRSREYIVGEKLSGSGIFLFRVGGKDIVFGSNGGKIACNGSCFAEDL